MAKSRQQWFVKVQKSQKASVGKVYHAQNFGAAHNMPNQEVKAPKADPNKRVFGRSYLNKTESQEPTNEFEA